MKKFSLIFLAFSAIGFFSNVYAEEEVRNLPKVEPIKIIDSETLVQWKLKEHTSAEESLKIADYYYYSPLGKNKNTAYDYYLNASGQGISRAQYMVGMMTVKGEGIEKNLTRGITKLRNVQGEFKSLALLEAGKLVIDRNVKDAESLFNESGLPESYYYMGKYYYNIGKNDKAVEYFKNGFAKKDPNSALELGKIYLTRKNFDSEKSFEYITFAANSNIEEAQDLLGDIYFFGNSTVRVDYKKAIIWYKKAADNGNLNSKSKLYQIITDNGYDNKYELNKYMDDQEFIYVYEELMKEYRN